MAYSIWVWPLPISPRARLFPRTSQELCDRLLRDAKVWINPGTMYGPKTGEGYVRLNIATQRSRLVEALNRVAQALEQI